MKSSTNDRIAVVIAYQSWVSIDNQVDYALANMEKAGECWARKLIRKILAWELFDSVLVLVQEDSSYSMYEKICLDEGAELRVIPKNLYKWPRSWYPWAWNMDNLKCLTEVNLSWVHWIQKSFKPSTYLVLSITGGFFSKQQVTNVFAQYKQGHRAAFHNKFARGGYVVDSKYLETVYPTSFEGMALLPDFEEHSHLEQTFDDQQDRNALIEARIKLPMGLWSKRHWDIMREYVSSYPDESSHLEFNSRMVEYLENNYFVHQQKWLNSLEIIFRGHHSNWLSLEHLREISRQAEAYGRVAFVMNFLEVDSSFEIERLINAVSKNLFLAVKLPIDSSGSLLESVLKSVDYAEFSLPDNLDYCATEGFTSQLFYKNWTLIYEEALRNQKPCFGLTVNIPEDSNQGVAMLEYFKNKVDFNPCLLSERVQGDGYPRTPNIKFESQLSREFQNGLNLYTGQLILNHQGRGANSKTVYESSIEQQLKLKTSE